MQHFIATYGYVAIFLLMLLESACIPVPSELIMTFGGALAAGAVPGTKLNLAGVIIAGVAGNVAGSYVAWAVGRYGGQPALRRWGRRLRIREHDLDRATAWFDRYGPRAVLIGRLLPVVRTFISLPAGIAGMDPARFGIYTTLGCIPWIAALAYAGYAVGANWHSIVDGFKGPTYIVAAIVLILLVIAAWRYLRAHRSAPSSASGDHAAPQRKSARLGAVSQRELPAGDQCHAGAREVSTRGGEDGRVPLDLPAARHMRESVGMGELAASGGEN
jgi:membrane protein DedA with SNARE-associated domain